MRVLWIPVAGTIAAALAVVIAHGKQEDTKYPIELPRADQKEFERKGTPPAPPGAEPVKKAPDDDASDTEAKERTSYDMRLLKDGTLVDADSGRSFKDAAAVATALGADGKNKPTVYVRNEEGVPESALDKVGSALKGRCRFVKEYRAPKKPK